MDNTTAALSIALAELQGKYDASQNQVHSVITALRKEQAKTAALEAKLAKSERRGDKLARKLLDRP